MSLMVTIRDLDNKILLWGQVHEIDMSSNNEITYFLTKVHVPLHFETEDQQRLRFNRDLETCENDNISTHLQPSSALKGG